MKMSASVWAVVVVLVVAGGWYLMKGGSSDGDTDTTMQPPAAAGIQESEDQTNTGQEIVLPVVTVANDATLGDYLVASNGMALYLSTKDGKDVSNCTGACAAAWPPYVRVAAETLVAGEGVTGTLGTITRADGSSQLTYNGTPLYFYKSDANVGDTTGQNVGGYWFVVKP